MVWVIVRVAKTRIRKGWVNKFFFLKNSFFVVLEFVIFVICVV